MRIAVFSDLHLPVRDMPVPDVACDLVILAGDIARPPQAIAWASRFAVPVLYVPGNHEYYGGSLDATLDELRTLAAGTSVTVLERDALTFGGVRFLGCTLWSDFRLAPEGEDRLRDMAAATALIHDFRRIRLDSGADDENPVLFTPDASRDIFDRTVAWLDRQFAESFPGPTVVVSHHAPARASIHPRFEGSPLNGAFISDLEERIARWQPRLWIHGHTHDSHRYRIGDTEVLCNPRGYFPGGVAENPKFDPALVVEV